MECCCTCCCSCCGSALLCYCWGLEKIANIMVADEKILYIQTEKINLKIKYTNLYSVFFLSVLNTCINFLNFLGNTVTTL